MSKFDSTELSAHKIRARAKKRKLPIKQKKHAMLKVNNNLTTPKEKLKGKLGDKMKEKKQMVVNKKKKGKEITEVTQKDWGPLRPTIVGILYTGR